MVIRDAEVPGFAGVTVRHVYIGSFESQVVKTSNFNDVN